MIFLALIAAGAQDIPASSHVTHPALRCWAGEKVGGNSDMTSFDTRDDVSPYLITHNRDQLRKGDQIEQDYNFIDYWFGEPARPVHARYYLRDERVTVDLPTPEGASMSLDQLRAIFPAKILCYLQKRFDRIEVRTDDGYTELWSSLK